ncbi:MAG: hypothetical protein Fur0011_4470 [Candidatus Microgenomates bacterium]
MPAIEAVTGEKKDFVGEKVRIGKMELTPIITEHDRDTWEKDGKEIIKELEKYSTIIPEYFPADYEPHLQENPLIDYAIDHLSEYGEYGDFNYLFVEIAKFSLHKNKEIMVVDPAYSEAFVKLRATRNWWMPVLGAVAASPFAALAAEHTKNFDSTGVGKTIKSIAKLAYSYGAAVNGVGFGTFLMVSAKDPMGIELDIRHVFIAESLSQIGVSDNSPDQAAIIYPTGHWFGEPKHGTKGILHYLNDPEDRKRQFDKYNSKFSERLAYNDFYRLRSYSPNGTEWVKKPDIVLEKQ